MKKSIVTVLLTLVLCMALTLVGCGGEAPTAVGAGTELSDGSGNITYTYSPSDYVIWIELDLKNLSTDTLEEFDCDLVKNVKLVYDEEYNYTGGIWFANDIPALESSKAFIYFEAPKEAYNGDGSKVATFEIGDTEYTYTF